MFLDLVHGVEDLCSVYISSLMLYQLGLSVLTAKRILKLNSTMELVNLLVGLFLILGNGVKALRYLKYVLGTNRRLTN